MKECCIVIIGDGEESCAIITIDMFYVAQGFEDCSPLIHMNEVDMDIPSMKYDSP